MIRVHVNRMIQKFRDKGALSAETARDLDELEVKRRQLFHRLVQRRIFIEAAPQKYYLNQPKLLIYNKKRRIMVITILLFTIYLLITGIYLLQNH
ncbi:MAG: hypothetical protein KKD74_03290 [Bacteroidetes bacterium]|nr:hypothetical protein [Bacteroidales bacterium]MBU1009141.1 hypothetical protein [Bacteroidota bacterium]